MEEQKQEIQQQKQENENKNEKEQNPKEMHLTLNDLAGKNKKIVIYRKHIKDFIEKKVDKSFLLFENELILITLPENCRAAELTPMYKLELNIEHYEGNQYLINPKNGTTRVVINPDSKLIKVTTG